MNVMKPKIIHIQYIYIEREKEIEKEREETVECIHCTILSLKTEKLRWNERLMRYAIMIRDHFRSPCLRTSLPLAVMNHSRSRRYVNRSRAAPKSK